MLRRSAGEPSGHRRTSHAAVISVGSLRIFPSVIKFQGDLGSFEFSQIPEPSSLLLFFSGLLALGYISRRRLAS